MVRAESDALTLTLVYTYSADGLLMARQVNTDVITFTWDVNLGLPQVLETSDGAQYVHGLDLIGEYRDDLWAYPLGDALGSVRQWTDEDGFVTYRGSYTPFGVALSSEGSTESAWGYTGELFDASLGDVYLRARWMDVSTGRFTRRDPWRGSLWQPGSMQGYLYAGGNPVLFIDPSGYFEEDEIMRFLGLNPARDSWDDVLAMFERGGRFDGRWGWLAILRRAELGDEVHIGLHETAHPVRQPWDYGPSPYDSVPSFLLRLEHDLSGRFVVGNDGELYVYSRGILYSIEEAAMYGDHYYLGGISTGAYTRHPHLSEEDWAGISLDLVGIGADVVSCYPVGFASGWLSISEISGPEFARAYDEATRNGFVWSECVFR